jgi:hypothetical protein
MSGGTELFKNDGSYVKIHDDGQIEKDRWAHCDMCQKPQRKSILISIDDLLWLCLECRPLLKQ